MNVMMRHGSFSEHFSISREDIGFVGKDLSRPECIVAEPNGTLWISDNRGGVTRLDPSGAQQTIGRISGTPNGIALEPSGQLLIADIGAGAIHRLWRSGEHHTILDSLAGEPLGSVNFVYFDQRGVLWVTVSTRTQPRSGAIERPIPDGYVMRFDAGQPRVVATGLCFANELRVDDQYRYVYVAESARGRIVRMPLLRDGGLGPPEAFGPAPLFDGAILDGITFDASGGLWVTEVTRNGLYRILPNGDCHCLLEDPAGEVLPFPASITFSGPDLRTVLVGSIQATRLATFRSPVPGAKLAHWHQAVVNPA
jgi:sugar lactone lactonase YvrE